MTISTMLRVALALLTIGALPLGAAAQSRIRAVHLSPDAPPVDIYIAGSATPTVSALGFGGASAVVPVTNGAVRMKVTLAGLPQLTLFDADVSVPENTTIDVLALNRIATPEASTIALPSGGDGNPDSSYLRLVDASPDAPSLDITLIDAAGVPHTFNGVDFKLQTPFFAVPEGKFTVELRAAGGNNTLLRVVGNAPAGEKGTIFASGLAADLKLRLLYETRDTQQIPMLVLEPGPAMASAYLRAVNVLPDSLGGQPVNADVTLGGATLFAGIAPGTATAFVGHDTGSAPFGVMLQGTPTTAGNIRLSADSAYSLIIYGAGSAASSTALLSRPIGYAVPGDSVLVRVVDGATSPTPLTFTVRTSGKPRLRESLGLSKASQPMMLPAGSVDLLITGSADTNLFRGRGSLPGGSIVTLIASSTPTTSFRIHVLVESDPAGQTPMPTLLPARRGKLRLVNASKGFESLILHFTDDAAHQIGLPPMNASPITEAFLGGPLGFTARWVFKKYDTPVEAEVEGATFLSQDTVNTLVAVQPARRDSIAFIRMTSARADTATHGHTLIRLLHASPASPPLDLVLRFSDGSTMRYDSLVYGEVTRYIEVPEGTMTMTIYLTGDPPQWPPLPLCTASPAPGGTFTVVIADLYAPDTPLIPERDNRVTMLPYLLWETVETFQKPMEPFSMAAGVETAGTGEAASLDIAPNPSHGETTVTYTLPRRGPAILTLYDMLGRPATRLDLGTRDAGTYRATVLAGSLPAGVYNVVLDSSPTAPTRLVIVR